MVTTLWDIQLFGGLRLRCGARSEARFRTQKTAALLAYLALFPRRTHPREELAVRFWTEDADTEARRSLRVALNSLRRQLEVPDTSVGELLVSDRATIGLRPEAFVSDVGRFEEALTKAARLARTGGSDSERITLLLEAAALYTAPLLPGFYDDWLLDERERLHSRFLDALDEAVKLSRKQGRAAEADVLALRRARSESSDQVAGTGVVKEQDALVAPPMPGISPAPAPTGDTLPRFFTRFWGRERELASLTVCLDDPATSVITLLGPGGIGKTRLSIEAARAWGKPVVWVPLASVTRGEEIADALRDALRLPATADDWEGVTAHLRERIAAGTPPLLLFDNFEQIEEDSGARFVARLLRSVPGIRYMVSSRRRLGVPGESLFAVEALPLPDEAETDATTLLGNPAAAMFADRARSATPDFAITGRNAASVAALCRLLDGLPLAIELAAAWVSVMTPGQMAAKLAGQGERDGLLTSRKTGDRVERHRSLWNTISWSYNLLPSDLRRMWRRLSVFHGGFTGDMARAVVGETFALEGLARLRERSLVRLMDEVAGDDPDEPRYDLLESLREFGGERVACEETREEQSALVHRHADSLRVLVRWGQSLASGDAAVVRYKRDLQNIRKALRHAEEGVLALEMGLEIAVGVSWLWKTGYLREGHGYFAALLRRVEETSGEIPRLLKARALFDMSRLTRLRGELPAAEATIEEALSLFRIEGRTGDVARCLASLGDVAQARGDFVRAGTYLEEALNLSEQADDAPTTATCLHNLSNLAYLQDDYEAMQSWCERELVVRLTINDDGGIAMATSNLAIAARERNDLPLSESFSQRTMCLFHKAGDFYSLSTAIMLYAELMLATGEWQRAATVYGIATARSEEQGSGFTAGTLEYIQTCQKRGRDAIGDAGFNVAFRRGEAMPLANAMRFLTRGDATGHP